MGEAKGLPSHSKMGEQFEASDITIKTDLLIVGAGPAGAGLACFLAAHGEDAPNQVTLRPRGH
jgi:hypothetical protein